MEITIRASVSLLLGFGLALLIFKVIIQLARQGRIPAPSRGFHHSHTANIPRLGGVGLVASFLMGSLIAGISNPHPDFDPKQWVCVVVCCVGIFALGFWDDLKPLGAKVKFFGQLIIATACYFGGVGIEKVQIPFTNEIHQLGLLGWPITVLWLVGMTNLINLVDGIDGLAAGISLMLMTLLTVVALENPWLAVVTAGVAGALLAFLKYNFPPAKIYMGDGGAYFLGFFAGAGSIVSSHKGTVIAALVAPLFVLALPIIDTSLAILRRTVHGLPIFRPDRRHIHHRLLELGFPREKIVLGLYAFTLLFLLLALGAFMLRGHGLPVLLGVGVLLVLLAAYQFDFVREWFAFTRFFQGTNGTRREIQYAMALSRWLSLEGTRCTSVQELLPDLEFACKKLGFAEVEVDLPSVKWHWKSQEHRDQSLPLMESRFLVGSRDPGSITFRCFSCPNNLEKKPAQKSNTNQISNSICSHLAVPDPRCPCVCNPEVFAYTAELIAEGWHKALENLSKRNSVNVSQV